MCELLLPYAGLLIVFVFFTVVEFRATKNNTTLRELEEKVLKDVR